MECIRSHAGTYASGDHEKSLDLEIALVTHLLDDAARSAAMIGRPELAGELVEIGVALVRRTHRGHAGRLADALLH